MFLNTDKNAETKRFSITRAYESAISGTRSNGPETEMHEEMVRQHGAPTYGNLYIPLDAPLFPATRGYTAGGASIGAELVLTSVLGESFIDLLRKRLICTRLGARHLMLQNPVTIPRQASAGTCSWTGGETDAATLSTGSFSQVGLTPHTCAGWQAYSRQLSNTASSVAIDQIVSGDLAKVLAEAIDEAALFGAGGETAEPLGAFYTEGVSTVTAGVAAPSAATFLSMESAIAGANGDGGSLAFAVTPKTRALCKTTQVIANVGRPLWENDPAFEPGMGSILGYKALASNIVKENLTAGTATTCATAIVCGDFSTLMIATFGPLEILLNPYLQAERRIMNVHAHVFADCAIRQPGSWAICADAYVT